MRFFLCIIILFLTQSNYAVDYFKLMTSSFELMSFNREGYIIKFKEERVFSIINKENKNGFINSPGEILKYKKAQWVILAQRDLSIYICDMYNSRTTFVGNLPNIRQIAPDAYLYRYIMPDNEKLFAYIFVTPNMSEDNKEKLYSYLKDKTKLITQKSGNYYLAISPEYANLLRKTEILMKAYREKKAKQIKVHMEKLGMTDIKEYNEYINRLKAKSKKDFLEKIKVAREKKHRESQKRAAAAEKIRKEKVDEETRKYKEQYEIEKERKRKAREYAGLTKEQIEEVEKKKKAVFEKSLDHLKFFEKGSPKSLKKIRAVLSSIGNKNRDAFKKFEHIPNYTTLKEIYPKSEEPQLLDAAFKTYTQYDFNAGLYVLNNMKSTDNDPRAVKLKILCLSRQKNGSQKCIEYYTQLLKKFPDKGEYKEKILESKKIIEEKKRILSLGFTSYTEMKKAPKKWAQENQQKNK